MCIKEFRDEFNTYSTNNTNDSILLHTMSIVPVDSTVDTPEHTYPVACGHKDKNNMIHEKHYIETLNELMKPNNKKKFYSTKLRKYISVVLFDVGIMMDQPGKRDYFNFAGGKGDYGAKFGYSCNFKDICNKLPSCEDCMSKLSASIDVDSCSKCLNWNFLNAEYSEDCLSKNAGMAKRPYKLSIATQKNLSKKVYDKVAEGKLNKQTAAKMIKPLNLNGNAVNLILESAINERDRRNENSNCPSFRYPDFIVNSRENLDFNKATSSPMHLLFLGVTNSAIELLLLLAKEFDIDKVVIESITNNMQQLLVAGIDFGPNVVLKNEKTSGWIASDYLRLAKVMPWVFKDMDYIMKIMFIKNDNPFTHAAKMCKNYSIIHNLDMPDTLKEKRTTIKNHKESLKENMDILKELKFQPMLCSLHKMISNIMASDGTNFMKLQIHIKQYLNEFHKMDQLLKKLKNETGEIPRWISQYNHLNIDSVIDDIKRMGPLKFMWEGNEHGEKYIQTAKNEFVSKKGNFGEVLIKKICAKKILSNLSNYDENESITNSDSSWFDLKSQDILQTKLDNCLPIPFILTHTKQCFFIIKNSFAIGFVFKDLVCIQMGWFYFNLCILKSVENPMLRKYDSNLAVKCVLLPNNVDGKICYTAVTNNWMTLDLDGNFNLYNNLDVNKRC